MSKLARARLVTAAASPPGRRAPPGRLLDGPFAETKELVLGDWPAGAGRFASVNGLRMYHEQHGRGRPLVLLHGALTDIDSSFGEVLSTFAGDRRVIAIEQQAHGRTADIDRPLSYRQMADDTVELLRQLDVQQADFLGFSMGGLLALQIAARFPGLTRKLAVVSGGYHSGGFTTEFQEQVRRFDGRNVPAPMVEAFEAAAGQGNFAKAVKRVKQTFDSPEGLRRDDLRAISAHTLFMTGQTGLVRREHTQEMADLVPHASVRVLPAFDHDLGIISRAAAVIPQFLEAPLPGGT